MTTPTMEQVFWYTWFTGLIYLVLVTLLAFRLGWLRKSGHASEAPTTLGFLFGWLGLGPVGFILTARHRQLRDRLASVLVVVCRTLLLAYLSLFAFMAWKFSV